MADVSDILGLELMEPGTRRGEWGEEFNEIIQRLEEAIAGEVTIQTTGGETVLTTTDIVQNEARMSSVRIIGELEEGAEIIVPARMKSTAFFNETTGAFAVAVRTEDGDPRIIPQGTAAIIRTRENGAVVFQTPPINLETGTVSPGFLDEKSISGSALVDEAVTADKLAEDAVTEPKIADEAVTADKLAEDAVTEPKIASGAVTENKIASGAVTNAKLASMANNTIKGNVSGGTAAPSNLTASQVVAILPEPTAGNKGVLRLPSTPTGFFLRDDGTFAAPVAGGSFIAPVRVATTGSITLSGEQEIDGIQLSSGDRVLVKDQGDASENGVYEVGSGDWSRASDFDEDTEVVPGTSMLVLEGGAQAGHTYTLVVEPPVVVDTSDLVFIQTGATVIPAGAIGSVQLAEGAVQEAKIADGAVTESKIANEAVTEDKIADGAVTEDKLANDSVTADKIPDGSISEAKLAFSLSGGTPLWQADVPVTEREIPNVAGSYSTPGGGTMLSWDEGEEFAGFYSIFATITMVSGTAGLNRIFVDISVDGGNSWTAVWLFPAGEPGTKSFYFAGCLLKTTERGFYWINRDPFPGFASGNQHSSGPVAVVNAPFAGPHAANLLFGSDIAVIPIGTGQGEPLRIRFRPYAALGVTVIGIKTYKGPNEA